KQTVLLTGATSGIGRHLAATLHALGNQVLVCARQPEPLAALATQYPGLATYVCDVSDPAQCAALAHWATRTYPHLNVVINNAGIMHLLDLTQALDLTKVSTEIATNLLAPIHLISLLTTHLQQQPTAAILNITSGLAFTPLAAVPVYSATKAALHAFTTCLRYQLRGTAVQVFEIIPPAVETNLGHADHYDRSHDHPLSVAAFVEAML
ncbi:SDR family oxidoreductase, partial [Hymenobacter crusticola]